MFSNVLSCSCLLFEILPIVRVVSFRESHFVLVLLAIFHCVQVILVILHHVKVVHIALRPSSECHISRSPVGACNIARWQCRR